MHVAQSNLSGCICDERPSTQSHSTRSRRSVLLQIAQRPARNTIDQVGVGHFVAGTIDRVAQHAIERRSDRAAGRLRRIAPHRSRNDRIEDRLNRLRAAAQRTRCPQHRHDRSALYLHRCQSRVTALQSGLSPQEIKHGRSNNRSAQSRNRRSISP
jgi:hypothetical protein